MKRRELLTGVLAQTLHVLALSLLVGAAPPSTFKQSRELERALRTASRTLVDRLVDPEAGGTCVEYTSSVAQIKFPGLALPSHPALSLGGNVYGVGGRVTTMQQCLLRDDAVSTFGWNWSRGYTNSKCEAICKAPSCFADFSFASVAYGISPFGGGHHKNASAPPITDLPVDINQLASFEVAQNVSYRWSDTAPGLEPPATGLKDVRRTRFIYDFFLTSQRPNGSNVAHSITDEVTINLASNAHFPSSQPPGCLDPDSRFGNHTNKAVVPRAVWDGYHYYDYEYSDHHDAVPGTGSRFSSFRRVGATAPGAQPPQKVNLQPFFAAIKNLWPGEQVGPWLGHVALATELFDHCTGEVTFHQAPTFHPVLQPHA